MAVQRNRVRLEESRQELDHLQAAIVRWLRRRRTADEQWQYRTQLASVETVALETIASLRDQLDGIVSTASSGEVYERCRDLDARALFVRRFWGYFRDRWDQRDDPELAPVLAAAEEVVWSCYAGACRAADRPVGPAPLPFVDPKFSPYAVTRARPPEEVRTSDDLLRATLAQLPVPVTALPPVCQRRPWWLALLAHETAHHLELDLCDGGLQATVRAMTIEAAGSCRGAEEEPDAGWRAWSSELFADAFAVASVGPCHLWLLEELELASERRMIAAAGAYPPRAARRYFGEHVLSALQSGDVPRPPLADEGAEGGMRFNRILEETPAVAKRLVATPIAGVGSVRELADWQPSWFAEDGDVDRWRKRLHGEGPYFQDPRLPTPRAVVAAAVDAWRHVLRARGDDDGAAWREERREHIATRTIELLALSREPGDRAATSPDAGVAALATSVATQLRDVVLESD